MTAADHLRICEAKRGGATDEIRFTVTDEEYQEVHPYSHPSQDMRGVLITGLVVHVQYAASTLTSQRIPERILFLTWGKKPGGQRRKSTPAHRRPVAVNKPTRVRNG